MTAKPSTDSSCHWARSFAPILGANPRLLILGSLPGRASLAAGQYYAHSRNLFWHFLAQVLGFSNALDYQERCRLLIEHKIAVWDVYAGATRAGSLDSAIEPNDAQLNDLPGLLHNHPTIRRVLCNGALAHKQFCRAWPSVQHEKLEVIALPSTSPANASQAIDAKLARWRAALAPTCSTV